MSNEMTNPGNPVESLTEISGQRLDNLYDDMTLLEKYYNKLLNIGLRQEDLPEERALQAFALLGDHEQSALKLEAGSVLNKLAYKGVTNSADECIPTPLLRLFLHVEPVLDVIDSLWSRLTNAGTEEKSTPANLQCITQISDTWGKSVRIHFTATDVTHVMIKPSEIFGLKPALLTADENHYCRGSFSIPIDNGHVMLNIILSNGELRQHRIHVRIGEPNQQFQTHQGEQL